MNIFRFSALTLACVWMLSSAVSAQMMKAPIPMTAAQFAAAQPGAAVQLAVRVTDVHRTDVRAELLERVNDTVYHPTGVEIVLYVSDDTPVDMGSQSDLTKGALLLVSGVATTKNHADAKKLVVLTKYASVQ